MQCPKCGAKSRYIPVCRACTPAQFPVNIRQSPIHNLGLFATCNIAEGDLIVPYMGDVLDLDTVVKMYPNGGDYIMQCGDLPVYINAQCHSGQIGIGGLANHKGCFNSQLALVDLQDQVDRRWMSIVWVRACKNIHKGEEITVDYGDRYHWR
jgi:hypothetical protein